ncbi:hypothetical protein HNQ07_001951 [Deinococcus metalli]|uniref:DUF7452 domain-containing protein n=1 Tax=Deinococcus metalli TaxID=1141878 RepID=A0A7W8KE33_9DEIO|nr:hypothetical protein [Deinococcus metalli]MBB5376487.1 hypothetical protein [Deinococcus metalli]GHF43669.1 hypothetical protein GCM10017781_20140 [Deinococcus metalli]
MKQTTITVLRSLLVSIALAAAVAVAVDFSTPHTFTAGTTIKASEMNDNFQAAQTELRRLDSKIVGFVHTSTAGNSVNNWTCIDNPATNDKPNAVVTVTHNYNPGGDSTKSNYDTNLTGVWYTTNKWCIYHEDPSKAMTAGKTYNVVVVQP